MRPAKILEQYRGAILEIASRHGATNVRVFGSVARGEDDENSDIHLLVDMEPGRSLFDLGGLGAELERLLSHKVDLGTARSLKARIRDRVLSEARAL